MKTITLSYDICNENPVEMSDHKIHSFNRRHTLYTNPETIGIVGVDKFGDVETTRELQSKLDKKQAFILSCYEHSGTAWSLKGEGMQCQWDTTTVAGILFLSKDLIKHTKIKDRQKWARSIVEEFTQWCNGEIYSFSIEDDGEFIDSCGGFYDFKQMIDEISHHLKDGEEVIIEGEAKDILKYHDFKVKVATV